MPSRKGIEDLKKTLVRLQDWCKFREDLLKAREAELLNERDGAKREQLQSFISFVKMELEVKKRRIEKLKEIIANRESKLLLEKAHEELGLL